jgi:hypothetical protein
MEQAEGGSGGGASTMTLTVLVNTQDVCEKSQTLKRQLSVRATLEKFGAAVTPNPTPVRGAAGGLAETVFPAIGNGVRGGILWRVAKRPNGMGDGQLRVIVAFPPAEGKLEGLPLAVHVGATGNDCAKALGAIANPRTVARMPNSLLFM